MIEKNIKETISFYRAIILDLVEQECGEQKNWKFIRGRLLKALGESGLEGRLISIIKNDFGGEL